MQEIQDKCEKSWQKEYGERGRKCNIKCNIHLIKLRLYETDLRNYEDCMKKCVTGSKEDPFSNKLWFDN